MLYTLNIMKTWINSSYTYVEIHMILRALNKTTFITRYYYYIIILYVLLSTVNNLYKYIMYSMYTHVQQ